MLIHPTAIVDSKAEIAPDVEIGAMAYVGAGCKLHSGVKIGIKAVVECHTEICENTILSPNAHVGGAPQDLGYKGEPTKLLIGKNNVIREFATIHRASTKESGYTIIGDNCYIMTGAHVAHDCTIGNNVIITNCAMLAGHISVDDFAVISGLTGFHQFVRVGTMAMVSGLSRVPKDVPPYCMVLSDSIVGLNVVGMRRRGITAKSRGEIKKAVGILTDTSHSMAEVRAKLAELEQSDEVKQFRLFVDGSKRGIMRTLGRSGHFED